jgi:hypothetical protein
MSAIDDLKRLLKRGALLAAGNWPTVLIQFVATTTFQALLAVPVVGAVILVAVLLGADAGELLQGSVREIVGAVGGMLASEPIAFGAFLLAFAVVLCGGSTLMFLVKGGVVAVLVEGHRSTGVIEDRPVSLDTLHAGARFTLDRFTDGCRRLFKSYLLIGLMLMVVYAASVGLYLAFVIYGYRAASGGFPLLGWTFMTALSTALLFAWITVVNVLYLLAQIAIAVDNAAVSEAIGAVARFIRAEFRRLAGVFAVVLALVIVATLASALAWSGVGLIAFVPLIGIAVFPLQLAALLLRGLVFEYLGLTALGAYVTLYVNHSVRRAASLQPSAVVTAVERPA